MTQDNHQQVQQVPYVAPEIPVRLTPQQPLGGSVTQIDALHMAEIGAMFAARGAEKGAVRALMQEFQGATIQAWLAHLPSFMSKLKDWEKARFLRLIESIRRIPDAPLNQGLLGRLMATPGPIPSYVDRAEVIRLITAAMEESPVVE